MLSKRLMLHLMLENGYKSFEIEKVLGISGETVRVHNNIWSKGGETYKKIIRRMAKREKTKIFRRGIEKILKPIDLALNVRTNMKARAKLASGDWFGD